MDTYEKKYNEALKWMRELYPGLHGATKEDAEHFFPELRESEEERTRKEIIEFIRSQIEDGNSVGWDRWIAWLEKQKDCILVPKSHLDPPGEDGEDGMKILEMQKEHKPNIELIQRSWYMAGYNDRKFGNEPKWIIKTGEGGPKHELNPKYGQPLADEQKPAEWSEEDEDMLNCCISSIEEAKENRYAYKETDGDTSYDREIAFLKSIRPDSYKNCNSRWKPSEEQMYALGTVVKGVGEATVGSVAYNLKELYEQLKKL